MYLVCSTHPYLAYAVFKVARSVAKPTSDWNSVKRILRCLRGTSELRLFYTSSGGKLCAYADADFAGNTKTRRSTNGFVSVIGDMALLWTPQLQKSVALSTTEVEFVVASEGARDKVLFYFVRELYQNGDINVEYICSENHHGDIFTKPLKSNKFKAMCTKIGLRN
ncbi:uncharacterized protein LOC126234908 [Schistocerca nitens]|uniref:uncharacterized protein LOC126234908 n=1 Tax=Schistocerca nitens TaxID=7011 RepID=UPI0021195030|nr:uncharacterized protein LOC126234908 [Schistocerca nitens]